MKLLLSEAQDLKEGMQHSLPWYPPVCNLVTIPEGLTKSYDHIQTIQDRAKLIPKIVDPAMRTVSYHTLCYFFKYGNLDKGYCIQMILSLVTIVTYRLITCVARAGSHGDMFVYRCC